MKKYIGLFAFVGMLFVSAAMFVTSNVEAKDTLAFASVEVGYTELSPNGEAGGYAVPASHCSGGLIVGHYGDSGNPGPCPQIRCPNGQEPVNGQCRSVCPDGQTRDARTGQCVGPDPDTSCPDGQVRNNAGRCVWPECPNGQTRNSSGQCVVIQCPTGQIRDANGNCTTPGCPSGQVRDAAGNCVQPPDPDCPNGQSRGNDGVCRKICNGGIFEPPECKDCPNGSVKQADGSCKCPAGQSCKPPPPPPLPAPELSATGICRADGTPAIQLDWVQTGYVPMFTSYEVHRCPPRPGQPMPFGRCNWPSIATNAQSPWREAGAATVVSGETYSYRVNARFSYRSSPSSNTVSIVAPTCTPGDITADLEIMRPDTNPGTWSDDDINDLGLTEEVNLRWTSSGAVQCQGTAFVTNGTTNGRQNSVTEPAAGDTTRYTVICENAEGERDSDSIDVTRIDGEGDGPSITADPTAVDTGGESDITWNVGSCLPAETTITASAGGTGLPDSYSAALTASNGTDTVTINETTTFTISCPAGSADVTVRAIPQIYES